MTKSKIIKLLSSDVGEFVSPSREAGQIVELRYAAAVEGIIVKTVDHSTHPASVSLVLYAHPRTPGVWEPWSRAPKLGRRLGRCEIDERTWLERRDEELANASLGYAGRSAHDLLNGATVDNLGGEWTYVVTADRAYVLSLIDDRFVSVAHSERPGRRLALVQIESEEDRARMRELVRERV